MNKYNVIDPAEAFIDPYARRCISQRPRSCRCHKCVSDYEYELRKCACASCYREYRYLEMRKYEQYRYEYMQVTPGIMFKQEYPTTVKEANNMNLVDKVKNLKLSAEDKLLRKHGVVDAEGNLTSTGKEILFTQLLDDYKTSIVADLKAVDAAEKAKK